MRKIVISCLISFLICAFFFGLGKVFNLFYSIYEYDSFVHLLGGIFAGNIGLLIAHLFKKEKNFFRYSIICSLMIGILWEICQCFEIGYWGKIGSIFDTSLDITMDVIGGYLSFLIHKKQEEVKKNGNYKRLFSAMLPHFL